MNFTKTICSAITCAVVILCASISAHAQSIVTRLPVYFNSNHEGNLTDDRFGVGNGLREQIATDGAGTWMAIWDSAENEPSGRGTINPRAMLSTSTDKGVTWSEQVLLMGNDYYWTWIAADEIGNWIIVGHSNTSTGDIMGEDRDIFFMRSTDKGLTWSPPALLNTNGTTDSWDNLITDISTDRDGGFVVAGYSSEWVAEVFTYEKSSPCGPRTAERPGPT